MADPVIASAPQALNFGGRDLKAYITSYSGASRRRSVDHASLKRDAAVVEDMGAAQRQLGCRLVFLGPNCAKELKDFRDFVRANPFGLLMTPEGDRWNAYTEGPDVEADFNRALDEIQVRCSFKESLTDTTIARDVPDPATAAQAVTAQQSQFKQTVGQFMGAVAKAQTFEGAALAKIDSTLQTLSDLTDPIDAMQEAITSAAGLSQQAVNSILLVAAKGNALDASISNYIDAASDLFDGASPSAAAATAADTLLGVVQQSALDLEATLISASTTPAGAADAVGDVEESLASCFVLALALQAARPPTIVYVVPQLMDVITVAMHTGPATSATTRASQILQLNRIPNPAAIAVGTRLTVPTR